MEVKAGYKQTEIGIIPEDWDLKSIDTIAKIEGGGTPSTQIDEYWDGQIPWISAGDISNAKGRYVKQTEFYISELGLSNSSTKIMPKDTTIIIARGATVGRMAQLYKDMAFNQTCYCLLPSDRLDKNYLYYSMLFSVNSIIAQSFGTIFGTITTSSFRDWQIPLPSLPEQEAIAKALSDADALIEALEQLIAKKRQVKQGAMQELLTGKRRLSGFSGKWDMKKLGELGKFRGGNGFPTRYQGKPDGDYPFYKVSDMNNEGNSTFMIDANNWISESVRKEIGANTFPKHTIVFAKIGAAIFLERKKILSQESCIDNNVMGFVLEEDKADYRFIHYLFLNIQLGKLVSATALPSLNGNQIAELAFGIPSLLEQTAIAEILSDMDAEIAALEGKLSKVRDVKAGMMQELLTGRVRLVDL